MDINPPVDEYDDEAQGAAVNVAELQTIFALAQLRCDQILTLWRAGAVFSDAAQYELNQAVMELYSALHLRMPRFDARPEPGGQG